MQYENPITCGKKVMTKVKVCEKYVKLQCQGHEVKNLWYHVKGLVTRNTHVQYESSITCGRLGQDQVTLSF